MARTKRIHGEIICPYFADMPEGTKGVVEHDHQEYWRFTYLKRTQKSFGNVRSFPEQITRTIHSVHFRLVA